MRAIVAAFSIALTTMIAAGTAQAQGWIDSPFDPGPISREDIATIQIALAYTGDFYGYADGVWNEGSQAALEQYVTRVVGNVKPTYSHLKDLVIFLEDERVANNWQLYYSEPTNVSYLFPYGLLKEIDNKESLEYLSDDGNFSLKIWAHTQTDMEGFHDYFVGQALKDSEPYTYRDKSIWITDAKLEDGFSAYVRSDFYNNQWTTLSMVVTEDHFYRMNVVAVSMTTGGSPAALMWTQGGVIDQVINGTTTASAPAPEGSPDFRDQVRRPVVEGVAEDPPAPEPVPAPGPSPTPTPSPAPAPEPVPTPDPGPKVVDVIGSNPGVEPERVDENGPLPLPGPTPNPEPEPPPEAPKVTGTIIASGTGFYIAPTTLITAAHVVEGCRAVAMIDGTPLEVLNTDSSLDLAVLSGATDAGYWLKLSALEVPKLGEQVTALGYPYYTSLDQGLTVTSGNVSALRGADGSSNRVMVTAPVQPGNSGGPLLNKKGAVIGVVVSRIDDIAVLEETGSLPQNMNFAVPSGPLLTFLAQSRITRPQGSGTGGDISADIPAGVTGAVVPLHCYQ